MSHSSLRLHSKIFKAFLWVPVWDPASLHMLPMGSAQEVPWCVHLAKKADAGLSSTRGGPAHRRSISLPDGFRPDPDR